MKRTYPAYKDSGIEWLGEIPHNWDVTILKRVCRFAYGDALAADGRIDGLFSVFGSNGIVGSHDTANTLGPCLIVGRKGSYGKVTYSDNPAFAIDTTYFIDKRQTGANLRWLYYLLQWLQLDAFSKDSAVPGLAREDAYDRLVPVCDRGVQDLIASFLDRKTTEIDALIGKKRRMIELLQEKRTAVISHAVTKGLDPNAPMKDSGVEWLDNLPRHWGMVPLKFVLLAKPGAIKTGPFGSQLLSSEMLSGLIKVYNQRNVIDMDFIGGDNYITEEKYSELSAFSIEPRDILVTTRGTIGRCAIFPVDAEPGILHPCLMRIQIDERKVLIDYLALLIQDGSIIREQLRLKSNATTIEVIYSDSLKQIKLPLPPISEQLQILSLVNEQTTKIDAMITKVSAAIDKLLEYRTALISAAVTGKIDVRNEVGA